MTESRQVQVLSQHWRREQGMTYGAADRCACGVETRPLAGDEDVSDRRAIAFAKHQAEMLDERPMTADRHRQDIAIEAAADALLAVCALQTGTDPVEAGKRALDAITAVFARTERERS